jgi:arginase family enzyme
MSAWRQSVKTFAVFFPFDLFGSSGTAAGAELLADAFREMLADNRRERIATRARAYAGKVRVEEFSFATADDYRDWRATGRKVVRQALDRGEFLLWVTGNHLGTLPVYEELGTDALVVQFDGHLDIYNLTDCTKELSHGNFLLHSDSPLPQIINVGHRELLLRPDYVRKYYAQAHPASALALDPEPVLEAIRTACGQAQRVFVDMDCDVLDISCFPALAHPLPFGLGLQTLLRLLDAAWCNQIAGFGVSEFLPARDQDDRCLAALMWLIEHTLLKLHE